MVCLFFVVLHAVLNNGKDESERGEQQDNVDAPTMIGAIRNRVCGVRMAWCGAQAAMMRL